MEFGLLGPVRAVSAGGPVAVGSRKQRLVLAVLLLSANKFVATTGLVRACWVDSPPPTARRIIHGHVSRLRSALAAAGAERDRVALARQGAGYTLICDPMLVDVHRFRELVRQARACSVDDEKAALLDQALNLWRGAPLDDVGNDQTRQRLCAGLEEARLSAMQDRWDALLRLGRHLSILDELVERAAEHPRQQAITGQLILALYRAGRVADALEVYRRYRRRLADEFGIDPGDELQRLEIAVLRADPALDPPRPVVEPAGPTPPAVVAPVAAQLPPDVPAFAGRGEQLAELDAIMPTAGQQVAAVVISGAAGVGKTALAVHWAHRVADRFPDGQLYVNLRGFDPSGSVMAPAEAVRGFLDALGVPPDRVPASLDAQTGLYRSLLSSKRILVLLDNARDADQVRPLLPATPAAMAVVTSRNQLTPLLAVEGAHPLTLDVLSPGGARDLLTQRVGADRIAAEPDAVQVIITACARLPLALSIAAARARQSGFPLATLAAELGVAGQPLDVLDAGDPTSDVRAVFSWSITAVTPPAGRLFRLLGQHPGPDIAVAAAASLAGHPVPAVRRLLTELSRASLLVEHAPGRYSCHDLLRVYATDLAATVDPADDRRAATGRLLDHYTHTAHTAERLFNPHRDPNPLPLPPSAPGTRPEQPADLQAATAWLFAERPVLLAAIRQAAGTGFDTHAWQLAWAVNTFLFRRGHWRDMIMAWQLALAAAERLGDLRAQAEAHRSLGNAGTMFGRYTDADAHLRHALDLSTRTGDQAGQARAEHNLAYLHERQGRPEQSLHHARQAFALHRADGNLRGQAVALNAVGWCYTLLGDHAQALTHCQQALALYRQTGNRHGQAAAWDSIGYAQHQLGDHARAVECYQQSLALSRDLEDRFNEGEVLTHLGDTYDAAGDSTAARAAWTSALAILADLDHPHAPRVRARLQRLPRAVAAQAEWGRSVKGGDDVSLTLPR
jgi:DNA-binding SARP family transcriptional activator/tetratricopeptide (TPR) repeat protein